MQFSEQRLRQLVNPSVDTAALAHQLTMAGLEVDAIVPVAPAFSGVVIGAVLSTEQHPNADKLRVTTVDIGNGSPLQIVCGAANVRPGLRVPVATVGAVLPGDFRIKEARLRGVESFGMLCAEQELGLAESSDGLWELPADAPVGADIRQWLALDDNLIELGLTPNRGDCLSLRGLARETAAVFGMAFTPDTASPVAATLADTLPVSVDAVDACPRYLGRLIRGVRAGGQSPLWLVDALRRFGVRSLSPVVDITNYVLLTLGQPLHAFDADRLQGGIVVRRARAGEQLTLLDQQTATLREQTLVIADQAGPVALAGIMGGLATAVTADSTSIFLESAFFQPLALAGEARRYGLHTDASHRYERGVDFALAEEAIELATRLIVEIAGGQAGPLTRAESPEALPVRAPIRLRRERIAQVLGFALADEQVTALLSRLGLALVADAEGWLATPPSHRLDLDIEVDLIEELARLYGYNQLPVTAPQARLRLTQRVEARQSPRRFKRALVDLGWQEAITFSFVEPGLLQLVDPGAQPLLLANPLSAELSAMRTTLWAGLALAARHNQSRQQGRVRLFETGLRFVNTPDGLQQQPMLAGIATGTASPEAWNNPKNPLDFFDVKGNIEAVLDVAGVAGEIRFVAGAHPVLHPGQCAQLLRGEQVVGWLGALHPLTQKALDLDGPVYVFELDLAALAGDTLPRFKALSRFPEVRRDLALLVPVQQSAQSVLDVARAAAGEWLREVRVFDLYRGQGVPDGFCSLAIALTWQHPDRTLTDDEVQALRDQVLANLSETLNVTLRA